jgi:hypothetical protein
VEVQASQDAVEQQQFVLVLVLVLEAEQELYFGTVVLLFGQLMQELQELA